MVGSSQESEGLRELALSAVLLLLLGSSEPVSQSERG